MLTKFGSSTDGQASIQQLEPFGETICSLVSGEKDLSFAGWDGKEHVSALQGQVQAVVLGAGSLCNRHCSPPEWTVPNPAQL